MVLLWDILQRKYVNLIVGCGQNDTKETLKKGVDKFLFLVYHYNS